MNDRWFSNLSVLLAWVGAIIVLFAPLLTLGFYSALLNLPEAQVAGATVGIGVILRATARRLLRTGARNVLQTTVGTFTRTTARAITRRVVRVAVKSFALVIKEGVRKKSSETEHDDVDEDDDEPAEQHPLLAIALGFLGLFFSLLGILYLLSWRETPFRNVEPQLGAVLATTTGSPLQALPIAAEIDHEPESRGAFGNMSIWLAALIGATPILVYAMLIFGAARWQNVAPTFQTGVDGLLLQAYFTGGMSFLPLTTDVQYDGSKKSTAVVAMCSLGGMFAVHLVFLGLAYVTGSSILNFTSTMFLLYCFVYSFPIRPLDGVYLWSLSKWLWVLFWIPILTSFILTIPESFNAIL